MVDLAELRARNRFSPGDSVEDRFYYQAVMLDFMFNQANLSPRMDAMLKRMRARSERPRLTRAG